MILALDTTGEFGSIALGLDLAMPHGAETLDEMELHAPEGFAQVLYGYVEEILRRNRAKLADVKCFAAACGPGNSLCILRPWAE